MKGTVVSYEKLQFQNHTECHCVFRNSATLADQSRSVEVLTDTSTPTPATTAIPLFSHQQRQQNCTTSFTRIEEGNGDFRCDCISGNQHCEAIKKGQEHLSLIDRRWIFNNNNMESYSLAMRWDATREYHYKLFLHIFMNYEILTLRWHNLFMTTFLNSYHCRCINNHLSKVPTCEYGVFSKSIGKCPTLEAQIAEARRSGNLINWK